MDEINILHQQLYQSDLVEVKEKLHNPFTLEFMTADHVRISTCHE